GLPAVSFGNQRQDCAKLLLEAARAFAIGLVENKNVANLHQPGFETLDVVAHARHEHHQRAIREAHDFNFALAHANCLDEDHFFSGSIKKQTGVASRLRESPEIAPGGHRADE